MKNKLTKFEHNHNMFSALIIDNAATGIWSIDIPFNAEEITALDVIFRAVQKRKEWSIRVVSFQLACCRYKLPCT